MTDIDSVTSQIRCATCDKELKSGALFCTSCGTRRDVEANGLVPTDGEAATAPPVSNAAPSEATSCASCGQPLRQGAEFCTECGTKTVVGDIDLTVDDDVDETATRTVERVNPAVSRAILKSVGGAGGGYVTTRATSGGGALKPPAPDTGDLDELPAKKRRMVVFGVAAAAILLIAVAVLALAGGGTSDKVVAGKSASGVDASRNVKNATRHAGRGNGTSTSAPGASSATTGSSASDSSNPAGKSGGTGGSKSSSSGSSKAGGSESSGGGPAPVGGDGGGAPAPVPAPPVVYLPGPARLSASGSVALTGTKTWGTVRIANTGGQDMAWSAGPVGVPNVVVSPAGGTLQPGGAITVIVSWSPWAVPKGAARPTSDEGAWGGAVNVNAPGVGNANLPLSADSRAADTIWRVAISTCVPTSNPKVCGPGSTIRIFVTRVAQGNFTGALPAAVTYQVTNDIQRSCTLPDPAKGCSSPDVNGTYPNNNFVVPVGSSIINGFSVTITFTDAAGMSTTTTLILGA